MSADTYRGWDISPPGREHPFLWTAISPNYDASYEGEEDGWVDNGERASGRTRDELIADIDEWFEENGE